jgi:hypothetical protein
MTDIQHVELPNDVLGHIATYLLGRDFLTPIFLRTPSFFLNFSLKNLSQKRFLGLGTRFRSSDRYWRNHAFGVIQRIEIDTRDKDLQLIMNLFSKPAAERWSGLRALTINLHAHDDPKGIQSVQYMVDIKPHLPQLEQFAVTVTIVPGSSPMPNAQDRLAVSSCLTNFGRYITAIHIWETRAIDQIDVDLIATHCAGDQLRELKLSFSSNLPNVSFASVLRACPRLERAGISENCTREDMAQLRYLKRALILYDSEFYSCLDPEYAADGDGVVILSPSQLESLVDLAIDLVDKLPDRCDPLMVDVVLDEDNGQGSNANQVPIDLLVKAAKRADLLQSLASRGISIKSTASDCYT